MNTTNTTQLITNDIYYYQTTIKYLEKFINLQYQIINKQDRLIDFFCFFFGLFFVIILDCVIFFILNANNLYNV